MTPARSKQTNPEITWGMLKRLQQRAEILMHGVGAEILMHGVGAAPTADNTFLAYLAIAASNNIVRSLFCFLFIIPLVTAKQVYWAHVADPPIFIGWLIAFIISAIIIAATMALTKAMQTAHTVADVLGNSMAEMVMQASIDQPILARLDALEAALVWL